MHTLSKDQLLLISSGRLRQWQRRLAKLEDWSRAIDRYTREGRDVRGYTVEMKRVLSELSGEMGEKMKAEVELREHVRREEGRRR